MKKLSIVFAGLLAAATINSTPANANPSSCLIDYINAVEACGDDTSCVGDAGLAFLLCEATEPPFPE